MGPSRPSRHWGLRIERLRLATEVVSEVPDVSKNNYPNSTSEIVEGFGNSLWKMSNNGNGNRVIPGGRSEIFLNHKNGPDNSELNLEPVVVYQAPEEVLK